MNRLLGYARIHCVVCESNHTCFIYLSSVTTYGEDGDVYSSVIFSSTNLTIFTIFFVNVLLTAMISDGCTWCRMYSVWSRGQRNGILSQSVYFNPRFGHVINFNPWLGHVTK